MRFTNGVVTRRLAVLFAAALVPTVAGCSGGGGGSSSALPIVVTGATAEAIGGAGDDVIRVVFTGDLDAASATDAANYELECPAGDALDLGTSIATLDAMTNEVTFTLVGDVNLAVGATFVVRATGVVNRRGTPIDPVEADATGVVAGTGATPTVTSADPPVGNTAGGYTLIVHGSGFTADADTAVTIGGQPAADVTVTSGSVLTATVPRGFAGSAEVRVANSNGTASGAGLFAYQPSFPAFRASLVQYTGNIPHAVAMGDFDGDGTNDLAITSLDDDEIAMMHGRGNGDFAPPVFVPAPGGPTRLRAADLNGDGILDMMSTLLFDDAVAVLLGHGDLTFDGPVFFPVAGRPEGLDVGDFDGDGSLDCAVACRDDKFVVLLFGDGAGGFPATFTSTRISRTPTDVVMADVDADGDLDVASANDNSAGSVSFLRNDGGRTVTLVDNVLLAGAGCTAIAAADYDGDGVTDIAVANGDSDDVSLFRGAGGGIYDPERRLTAGDEPTDVGFTDANGDGQIDLFSTMRRDDQILIWMFGTGPSIVEPPLRHDVDHEPKGAVFGDVTNDGIADMVTVNTFANTVSVFLGEPDGSYMDKIAFPADRALVDNPIAAALRDFDGDGIEDLALLARGTAELFVFRGDGAGSFVEPGTVLAVGGDPTDVACADLDGDGDPDLLVADPLGSRFVAFLGDGAGGFGAAVPSPVGYSPFAFRIADFDEDGLPDVVTTLQASSDIGVAFGAGGGVLDQDRTLASAGGVPLDIAIGDFDADGHRDVVVGERIFLTGQFSFFFGTGAGDLILARTMPVDPPPFRFTYVDITKDGNPDLVTTGRSGVQNWVTTYVASGFLNFLPGNAYLTGEYPFGAVAVDYNRDGNLDIAAANHEAGTVTLFNGDSTGVLGFLEHMLSAKAPARIYVGDFDRNGAPDLLTVDELGDGVTIFLNRS